MLGTILVLEKQLNKAAESLFFQLNWQQQQNL
jgi:hypothetical protein